MAPAACVRRMLLLSAATGARASRHEQLVAASEACQQQMDNFFSISPLTDAMCAEMAQGAAPGVLPNGKEDEFDVVAFDTVTSCTELNAVHHGLCQQLAAAAAEVLTARIISAPG